MISNVTGYKLNQNTYMFTNQLINTSLALRLTETRFTVNVNTLHYSSGDY